MSANSSNPNRAAVDRAAWDVFARHQPFYHICSHPSMVDPGEAEQAGFWAGGDSEIQQIQKFGGLTFREGLGVDFGCGMGRLTRAMRALTSRQIGIDISPEMLERARRCNQAFPSAEFRLIEDGKWPLPGESCELAISVIVFQHLSTEELMEQSLEEFGRVLKPGGRAVFQLITRTWKGDLLARLRGWLGKGRSAEAPPERQRLLEKIEAAGKDPTIPFTEEEIQEMIALDFRRMKSMLLLRLFRVLRRTKLKVYRFQRERNGVTWVAAVKG